MTRMVAIEALDAAAFAPFGEPLEAAGASFPINGGRCDRFHDLARLEFAGAGPILSVFRSRPVDLPYEVHMMERHPLGSQAFAPLGGGVFLVIVAEDAAGAPGRPRIFRTRAGQGVNIGRNVWHGPLAPLGAEADFLVVDRGGDGADNLEEHRFEAPYIALDA